MTLKEVYNTKIKNHFQLHLFELKYNFIVFFITFFYLFIVSYYFSNQLIYLFINILTYSNILKYFIFTNITELFLTNIIISIFISAFLSIQLLVIQFWIFLSSGLFKFENLKFIKFYILFITLNFIIIFVILMKFII